VHFQAAAVCYDIRIQNGMKRLKNEYGYMAGGFCYAQCLINIIDGEEINTGIFEDIRNLHGSVAIGVGLYNGAKLYIFSAAAFQLGDIMQNRIGPEQNPQIFSFKILFFHSVVL